VEYLDRISKELKSLIEEERNTQQKNEKRIQEFFEKHPSTLLGVLESVPANYNVFEGLVISQPRLSSFNGDRSPDFLIITWNSLNLYFNFIEIEDPSKTIFKANENNTNAVFNQALNQIQDWKAREGTDVQEYCDQLLKTLFQHTTLRTSNKLRHYQYVLLYGFSEEVINQSATANALLAEKFGNNALHHCTYSRLISYESSHCPWITSVKKEGGLGKFRAIGWQPCERYYKHNWDIHRHLLGKEELVKASDDLSDDAKEKLLKEIEKIDEMSDEEFKAYKVNQMGSSIFDDLEI